MNRREFVKTATVGASLLVLPSLAIASVNDSLGGIDHLRRKITHLRIGCVGTENLRLQTQLDRLLRRSEVPPTPPDDENIYWAEAIEDGDKFYYEAKGITVEIAEWEFRRVIGNPTLYYFSTALRLHLRIERATKGIYDD